MPGYVADWVIVPGGNGNSPDTGNVPFLQLGMESDWA